MNHASTKPLNKRFCILFIFGVIVLGIACVWRFVYSDMAVQTRAEKMSDDSLSSAAGANNASYTYIIVWAKRLEASARFVEAEHVYSRAMEANPTSSTAWIGFGRTAFAAGDWGKSIAVMGKTVEQWPESADAHFTYASVLASTYRVHKAIDQLKLGLKLDPSKGEAFQTLGDLELRADDNTGAVEAYSKAVALIPTKKGLKSRYGSALVKAGKFAEAKTQLEAALADDPADNNARFELGKALAGTGKEEDRVRAIQELNRVVAFADNKGRAYYEAARIFLKSGDRGNGLQSLERAYDRNPYNLDILKLLVQTYTAEGRKTDAESAQKALQVAQTTTDSRKKLLDRLDTDENPVSDLILLGRLDISVHNQMEAETAFQVAKLLDPGNQQAINELKSMKPKPAVK